MASYVWASITIREQDRGRLKRLAKGHHVTFDDTLEDAPKAGLIMFISDTVPFGTFGVEEDLKLEGIPFDISYDGYYEEWDSGIRRFRPATDKSPELDMEASVADEEHAERCVELLEAIQADPTKLAMYLENFRAQLAYTELSSC